MKKLFPVLLAVILLLSYSPPALAAEGDDDGGTVGGLLDGLKGLFIPDDDFFDSFNEDIQNAIDKKTGGLATSFQTAMNQFNRLQSGGTTNSTLKLTMPDNLLFQGYKGTTVDMLGGIGTFATWFRGLTSAFAVITTLIYCYRKVVSLFKG